MRYKNNIFNHKTLVIINKKRKPILLISDTEFRQDNNMLFSNNIDSYIIILKILEDVVVNFLTTKSPSIFAPE